MNHLHRFHYIVKHPSLVWTQPKRLFMLSHMRSRSSLLSHILGSNEAIAGYSELSIRYKNTGSLLDQKIALHQDGLEINSNTILFDKVLHNSYDFKKAELLNKDEFKVIVMVRPPEATVKSIVTMGRKQGNAKYGNIDWACDYYIGRLDKLVRISQHLDDYIFVNSDDIVNCPDETLTRLTNSLNLKTPLSTEYSSFNKTGMKKSGDTSDNIKKGRIVLTRENNDITISESLLKNLNNCYESSFRKLSEKAAL